MARTVTIKTSKASWVLMNIDNFITQFNANIVKFRRVSNGSDHIIKFFKFMCENDTTLLIEINIYSHILWVLFYLKYSEIHNLGVIDHAVVKTVLEKFLFAATVNFGVDSIPHKEYSRFYYMAMKNS